MDAYKEAMKLLTDPDFISKVVNGTSDSSYFSVNSTGEADVVTVNFDKFGIKKVDNAPDAIIIDEATHLSNLEIQLLSQFAKLNGTKLEFLGDNK